LLASQRCAIEPSTVCKANRSSPGIAARHTSARPWGARCCVRTAGAPGTAAGHNAGTRDTSHPYTAMRRGFYAGPRAWQSSTASFMRTVMKSSPIRSCRPAARMSRTTCRDGLAKTGWMPRSLWSLIQSCARGRGPDSEQGEGQQTRSAGIERTHSSRQPRPRQLPPSAVMWRRAHTLPRTNELQDRAAMNHCSPSDASLQNTYRAPSHGNRTAPLRNARRFRHGSRVTPRGWLHEPAHAISARTPSVNAWACKVMPMVRLRSDSTRLTRLTRPAWL